MHPNLDKVGVFSKKVSKNQPSLISDMPYPDDNTLNVRILESDIGHFFDTFITFCERRGYDKTEPADDERLADR